MKWENTANESAKPALTDAKWGRHEKPTGSRGKPDQMTLRQGWTE
jgi:hypothetical protein